MKKFFVSTLVIVTFSAYVWHHRTDADSQVILPPKSLIVSPTIVPLNTPTPLPSSSPQTSQTPQMPTATPTPKPSSIYKDGAFTGDAFDAFYGNIQVQVVISNGKMTQVNFLQAPNDRGTSIEINRQADPMLAQEAISAQSAKVDIISGATDSSQAFVQSLQSALNKAKN